jgi:hypothetical protein
MNEHWYRWQNDTLLLKVHLHPGAKTTSINRLADRGIRIKIKSPPVDGKANRELIALLASDFRTKKSQVRICSGELGRDKVMEIQSPAALPEWFIALGGQGKPA